MRKMSRVSEILRNMTMIGQLGLSLIMPLLMMMALCWFLTNRVGLGRWVYIIGFILGIGAGFMTAYKVYLSETQKNHKKDGSGAAFNRHM